jgi:hypothetical protein
MRDGHGLQGLQGLIVPAVRTKLVVIYDLWAICGDCLKLMAEICIDGGEEDIGIAPFGPVAI